MDTDHARIKDQQRLKDTSIQIKQPAMGDAARPERQVRATGAAQQHSGGRALSLEGAATHLLSVGAGWLIMAVGRAIRGKQRRLTSAQSTLAQAEADLAVRVKKLAAAEAAAAAALQSQAKGPGPELTTAPVTQKDEGAEVQREQERQALARSEVEAANVRCREAAEHLQQTMSDLRVTQTELRSSRTQLQGALNELRSTRARSEGFEGELGLTLSENTLLKRELTRMQSQLEGAARQLAVSRGHGSNGARNWADVDDGMWDGEDGGTSD